MPLQMRLFAASVVPLTIGAVLLATGGCGTSTSISNAWRDPSYPSHPMKNWLVFGTRLDATHRRMVEDSFTDALVRHGARATQSYKILPDPLPDREPARGIAQRSGFDASLVAAYEGTQDRMTIVPGTYAGGFWGGYYGEGWGLTPGYVASDQFVNFETTVWDLTSGDGKLVWAATTKTENPTSGKDFVSSLTNKLIPTLNDAGFLPSR